MVASASKLEPARVESAGEEEHRDGYDEDAQNEIHQRLRILLMQRVIM